MDNYLTDIHITKGIITLTIAAYFLKIRYSYEGSISNLVTEAEEVHLSSLITISTQWKVKHFNDQKSSLIVYMYLPLMKS